MKNVEFGKMIRRAAALLLAGFAGVTVLRRRKHA